MAYRYFYSNTEQGKALVAEAAAAEAAKKKPEHGKEDEQVAEGSGQK
jgi:hypothetical protein